MIQCSGAIERFISPLKNQSAEPVCDGTFTKEGPNNGKFSLSCFDGYFSGNGQYERKTGDPNNSFIAHGQTSRGLPIMLVIGRPTGRPVTMAPI